MEALPRRLVRGSSSAARILVWVLCVGGAAGPSAGSGQDAQPSWIRIGLADGASAARISAGTPFTMRAGAFEIEATEALVSPETGASAPTLALGSFPGEEAAREAVRAFADAGIEGGPARVVRDPETGRYLAAVAYGPDPATGVARLAAAGFVGAGVFQLPRPVGSRLVIRSLGDTAIHLAETDSLIVVPPSSGEFLEWEGSPYRGDLVISRVPDGVTVVNRVVLEDYLLGVVPRELPPLLFPELEALKAQALAARTYALRPREAWRARGYDLCSGPGCQVYGGVAAEHPLSNQAVRETVGEAILFEGRLIDALYTAACGGSTENAENVFSTPTPYLVARACLREAGGVALHSRVPADEPLDAALVRTAGPLPGGWGGPGLREPAESRDSTLLLRAVLTRLGLPVCAASSADTRLTLGEFARLAEAIRCRPRPRRGPAPDGSEFAGDGPAALGRLLAEGLLNPEETGADPGRPVSRREVVRLAAALLRRYGPPFRRRQIRRADSGEILLEPVDGERGPDGHPLLENLRLLEAAPDARFFREVRPVRIPGREDPAPVVFPERVLRLRPGDFVRYREIEEAESSPVPGATRATSVSVLIQEDLGEALDRFSRLGSWLVPKNNRDLSASISRTHPVGEIVALEPLETGLSGRVVRLRVVGTRDTLELRGLRIRRALGISENLFFAEPRRDQAGGVTEWWFSGRGWGHGLGLCQAGAYGMAAAGADYREILAHYYPGTEIRTVGAGR